MRENAVEHAKASTLYINIFSYKLDTEATETLKNESIS